MFFYLFLNSTFLLRCSSRCYSLCYSFRVALLTIIHHTDFLTMFLSHWCSFHVVALFVLLSLLCYRSLCIVIPLALPFFLCCCFSHCSSHATPFTLHLSRSSSHATTSRHSSRTIIFALLFMHCTSCTTILVLQLFSHCCSSRTTMFLTLLFSPCHSSHAIAPLTLLFFNCRTFQVPVRLAFVVLLMLLLLFLSCCYSSHAIALFF